MSFMDFRNLAAATAIVMLPLGAAAATVQGQIDITGLVNLDTSAFNAAGNADLQPDGLVQQATGDFGTFASFGDLVGLNDIDFTAPGVIWEVAGFSFTATAFSDFQDGATKAFTALGTIIGNGFDATDGVLTFTAQENDPAVRVSFSTTTVPVPLPAGGLLLLTALGGLAVARRRKAA